MRTKLRVDVPAIKLLLVCLLDFLPVAGQSLPLLLLRVRHGKLLVHVLHLQGGYRLLCSCLRASYHIGSVYDLGKSQCLLLVLEELVMTKQQRSFILLKQTRPTVVARSPQVPICLSRTHGIYRGLWLVFRR